MIAIRQLSQDDSQQYFSLITEIEAALPNKEFWLPIDSISRSHFFDKNWTIIYGAFDGALLVGASSLFLNEHEYSESLQHMGFAGDYSSVSEIGRSMVKPSYRGNGILFNINKLLLQEAINQHKSFVLATIHPNNTPSQCSFKKLGLRHMYTYTKECGYVRDVLMMGL